MTYRAGFALLAAALLSACAVEGSDPSKTGDAELYARSPLLWPRAANGGVTQLRVCWKNPGETIQYPAPLNADDDMAVTTTEEEGWARRAIEETWQRELAIDFVGWERCVGGEDIPILISDWKFGSKVDDFGSAIGEMRLNLTHGDAWRFYQKRIVAQGEALGINYWVSEGCDHFNNAYSAAHPEFVAMSTDAFKSYYRTCLSGSVVHEFGHALGFLHEQYRRDGDALALARENACHDEARRLWGDTVNDVESVTKPGDVPLGPFDPESIMSYCRHDWTTYQPTTTDYAFAGSLYGRR